MRDYFFQIILFLAGAIIGITGPLLGPNRQKKIAGILAALLIVASVIWAGYELSMKGFAPTDVPAARPNPTPTYALLPSASASLTPTPSETPSPIPSATRTPTGTPPPAPVPKVPSQGLTYRNPVSFRWEGILAPGQTYLVRAWHPQSGASPVLSATLSTTSWTATLPAAKFGAWRWSVAILQDGSAIATSAEGTFWFNPFTPTPSPTPKPDKEPKEPPPCTGPYC